MKQVVRRIVTAVLSVAMIASSISFTPSVVKADTVDDLATARNIALGKDVTCYASKPDGDNTTADKVTDGSLTTQHFAIIDNTNNDWGKGGESYITIDLGDYYDASSIDEIWVSYKNSDANVTPINKSYKIDYSVNGTAFNTVAVAEKNVTELGEYHETIDDVSSVTGTVRYVRVTYPKTGGYGIQIREIAVLASTPVKVQVEECDNVASVAAQSNDVEKLTYSFVAGDNQDGYSYDAYLDGAKLVGENVKPGQEYTVNNVSMGTHYVVVVSKYNGNLSTGVKSNDVEVIDQATAEKQQFMSNKNIAYKGNNASAALISSSSFYNENYTLESSQLILDGDITHGEGADRAFRTASGEKTVEFVIDLGANYSKAQFDKVMIEYQNGNTFAANTKVYVSEISDADSFTLVADKEGYAVNNDDTYHVNTINLDMSQYGLGGVRYVKVELNNNACAYGYIIHEVGVLLNVATDDATIATAKNPIDSPVIASKAYTGSNLKADVPASDDYTVVSNNGGTAAGTYDVVLKLKDFNNNYWKANKGAGTDEVTVPFEITQAENAWTSDLTIQEWGRGETPNEPQVSAKFGSATFTYSDTEDGDFTETVPTMTGDHYVKATVPATDNYTGLTQVKKFHIGKGNYPDAPTLTVTNPEPGVALITISGLVGTDTANVYRDGRLVLAGVRNGTERITDLIRGTYTFTAEAVRGANISDKSEPVQTYVEGEYPLVNQMTDPAYNLALGKVVSVSQFVNEGSVTAINDGKFTNFAALSGSPEKEGWGVDQPCYFVIDLGDTYDVSTLEDVVVYYRNTGDKSITVEGRNFSVGYSSDGVHYNQVYITNSARYTDATAHNTVTSLRDCEGVARYIRVHYTKTPPYGMHVTEAGVIAPNAVKVDAPKCDDAAGVVVESTDYNVISYTIMPGDNQEDFLYNVYLDGDLSKPVALGVSAGETFEIKNVEAGTHTLTIVAVHDGAISDGINSDAVTVLDANTEYLKVLEGTRNIASVKNNGTSRIIDLDSFYDEDHNIDQAQVALDGVVGSGEGADVALRTQSAQDPVTMVIDLGANYATNQIEKLLIEYGNPRTYAADTKVWVAERYSDDYFALVADEKGYKAKNEHGNVNFINFDKSGYGMSGIRFIKIQISGGSKAYGYVIHEIGVMLNVDAADATIAAPKTEVEIPTLDSRVYTGETLTAQIPNNSLYTAVVNEGGVDAGEYSVTLKLKDFDHYYWAGDIKGLSDETEVSFNITQAENEWFETVDIKGWKYGEEPNKPSASAKFGQVVYHYGKSLDGSFTAAPPTDAGDYYVKAFVSETPNFKGISCTKAFSVTKGEKAAPTDIESRASTIVDNADGAIFGVSTSMEFRPADAGSYAPIYSDTISNIKSGLYYVRYKETNNTYASADTPVMVETGRKLTVTYAEGEHYTIRKLDDSDRYTYGTPARFEVVIQDGYQQGFNFKVTANGEMLQPEGNIYTIPAVRSETLVEVSGIEVKPPVTTVAPTTAPKAPGKATIKKIAAKKKSAKKLKVTVKAVAGATGYRWAVFKTKKNAKKNKKALYKKNTAKKTFTINSAKIKNKKSLFVRVRAYKVVNGTYLYGPWSAIKKVKIKK